jgi:feruloyl esterase
MNPRTATVLILSIVAVLFSSSANAAPCESVVSLPVKGGTVTLAQTVAAGGFTPPAGRAGAPAATGRPGGANPFATLAGFCRVAVTLKPAPRSEIKAEIWMPLSGWNGKLQVVGNGGFAGTISYAAMATALAAGYASASTDTGHTGPSSNTFANEDSLIDFAYRAIHETTVAAKSTVNGFYGRAPRLSYFAGCSTGGRQALTAAQRYPEDFNGIVAGAPASHTSTQAFGQVWFAQALADAAASLPREKLSLVHDAVLNACDALDGAKDGVLENPLACTFDPKVLSCGEGGDQASCLTTAQVAAVQKVYAGPSNPRTHEPIYAGLERGSELGWSAVPVGYAVDYFRYIVFKDPAWDFKTLNYDSHLAQAARSENLIFDATNPDLSAFTGRGGKLIMYQGWGEPGIPPANLVKYYGQVQTKTTSAASAVRLFMVPGMGHCGGGTGVNTFDMVTALDQWVSGGKAPTSIPASRVRNGTADRTRPLCPHPQIAIYKGSGSLDDATNFACGSK